MKNFTKLTLILSMLFGILGGANSVKAEKFIALGSVLTLAEAEEASTSGTGVAIVYNNSKLFANNTGGDPAMSLVDVSNATRGYMFKLSKRFLVDDVQYYRIQCYNPNSSLIAAGDAAGAYGNNILSPVSWGSVWASSIDEEKESEVWDGRSDYQYGAQWCFESDGAGGYYIKTRAVGSTKPYLSSSGSMTEEANKVSYKFYSLEEVVPYSLEWTPNAGTYRATVPLSKSHIRATGDVSINYSTGEVTNTGSGKLIIYLNNENLVGATGYNLTTSGGGLLGNDLGITDAVNGEVGGIYGSRNSWWIAGDGSRKDKIGAVKAFTYNFSGGTGSQTITSIYFDSDLVVAETTEKNLTDMPYGRWGLPANKVSNYIDKDSYKTNNIDGVAHNDVLYGHDGNGDAYKYVDLTNCKKIIFTGFSSNGVIRLFYNWSGTDVDKPIEIINDFPTTSGTYVFDIEAFKKAKGISFFHLNGIKSQWADVTLSSVKVVEYTNAISGSGINRAKNYLSNPYITSIDATGITAATALTLANPNCLIVANAGKVTNDNNVIVSGACANFVLADNKPFKAPDDFTATAASYDRSIAAATTTTVCLPFALTQDECDAIGTFYTLTGISGDYLQFAEVTSDGAAAKTPYLVVTSAGDAKTFAAMSGKSVAAGDAITVDGTNSDGTQFIGTLASTLVKSVAEGDSYYGLNNGTFVKAGTSGGFTLPAFRGYVKVSGGGAARLGISFINDEVTGIKSVANSQEKKSGSQYFDLQGRRVSKPVKGLYVVNGKKMVIK